jgi:hypothetical protein
MASSERAAGEVRALCKVAILAVVLKIGGGVNEEVEDPELAVGVGVFQNRGMGWFLFWLSLRCPLLYAMLQMPRGFAGGSDGGLVSRAAR